MTGNKTVVQSAHPLNSVSRNGTLTLVGFGISVSVDKGHLIVKDGIGTERSHYRLPRIGHRLKRLAIVGSDGLLTLAALKWLRDQDVSLAFIERNGKVLSVVGPRGLSDAKLRRSQALAMSNGVGLEICRTLIEAKLQGQESVLRELNCPNTADSVSRFRERVKAADSFDNLRNIEARAAASYFREWRDRAVSWPKADLQKIPEHWKFVGSRQSPLTGGPRLAVTPVHAILNYCFALLESETRLAITCLGLDAGLGLGLHTDTADRSSLVFDVLEPVRPQVESWVIGWIQRERLRRADFFETSTGNCRLRSHLCARLSETAPTWGKLVGRWAEFVARAIWARKSGTTNARLATPLTQQHRRQAKGNFELAIVRAPRLMKTCRGCGVELHGQRKHCSKCGIDISRANMIEIAHRGRVVSKSAEALAKQSAAQKRQRAARRAWNPSSFPSWLTRESYREMIWTRLAKIAIPRIAKALNVSEGYASRLRKGLHVPHRMHWETLATLSELTVAT